MADQNGTAMKTSNHKTGWAVLFFAGSLVASGLRAPAQAPGTIPYYAEIEIQKKRLLTLEQIELALPLLPTQYLAQAEAYIDQVRAGRRYEYEFHLWADLGASSDTRATNVFLTFPDGRTRVGTLNAENDLVFPDWGDPVYTFAELKAAVPPGRYQLVAYFREGAGTNYTAELSDYTEGRFPPFINGQFKWDGTADTPLSLQWNTIPGNIECEVSAQVFPVGPDLYDSGSFFPAYPNTITNELTGALVVGSNYYSASIEAEEEGAGDEVFTHEFISVTDFYFIPAKLAHLTYTLGGPFECDVLGGNGTSYLIEGSMDLVDWTPLNVVTVFGDGCSHFTDPEVMDMPRRFYRASRAPAP
jgi:hypothetical protein